MYHISKCTWLCIYIYHSPFARNSIIAPNFVVAAAATQQLVTERLGDNNDNTYYYQQLRAEEECIP